ncbi:hypothetical protein HKCCE4037_16080 [Rhodobacterales bacterium HKCCE4037]|nr:hypothetical protein [Rhodobacterales bacterium HKCCE4037]
MDQTPTASPDLPRARGLASGTMLLTRDGMMPVDWITLGDELWTQDNGWQPVRWRGLRQFGAGPDFDHPIQIRPDALGPGNPAEPLLVAPDQRLRLSGAPCELCFGTVEVLVRARDLLHWPGVSRVIRDPDYAYHLFLFDRHEVLMTDGTGLDSLFLGDTICMEDPVPAWKLVRILRFGHDRTARLCVTGHEAHALPPGAFPDTLLNPGTASDQVADAPARAVA